jgi:hypothetical protein
LHKPLKKIRKSHKREEGAHAVPRKENISQKTKSSTTNY